MDKDSIKRLRLDTYNTSSGEGGEGTFIVQLAEGRGPVLNPKAISL
jgi:hypothetical protein